MNVIIKITLLIAAASFASSCGGARQPAGSEVSAVVTPVPQSSICVTDLSGNFPGGGSGPIALTASCKTNQEVANFFNGFSVFLGVLTVACEIPGPHSVGLPVFAAGGAISGALSFTVSNLPCDQDIGFSEPDDERIDRRVCLMMGKTFSKGTGPNGANQCL